MIMNSVVLSIGEGTENFPCLNLTNHTISRVASHTTNQIRTNHLLQTNSTHHKQNDQLKHPPIFNITYHLLLI